MILCIESHLEEILLSGKIRSRRILEEEIAQVENCYDRAADNFVPLLCRRYHWTPCDAQEIPDVTYDRDTGLLLPLKK